MDQNDHDRVALKRDGIAEMEPNPFSPDGALYLRDILFQVGTAFRQARRRSWPEGCYVELEKPGYADRACDMRIMHQTETGYLPLELNRDNLTADDWELIPEPIGFHRALSMSGDVKMRREDWEPGAYITLESRTLSEAKYRFVSGAGNRMDYSPTLADVNSFDWEKIEEKNPGDDGMTFPEAMDVAYCGPVQRKVRRAAWPSGHHLAFDSDGKLMRRSGNYTETREMGYHLELEASDIFASDWTTVIRPQDAEKEISDYLQSRIIPQPRNQE